MKWNFYATCANALNYIAWNFLSGSEVNSKNIAKLVVKLERLLEGYIISDIEEGIVIMPQDGNSNPIVISIGGRVQFNSDHIVFYHDLWTSDTLFI